MNWLWRSMVSIVGLAGAITAAAGALVTVAGILWVAVPPPYGEMGAPIVPGFVVVLGVTCVFLGLAYGYLNGRKP